MPKNDYHFIEFKTAQRIKYGGDLSWMTATVSVPISRSKKSNKTLETEFFNRK